MEGIIQILEELKLKLSYIPTSADRKNLSTVKCASFSNPWIGVVITTYTICYYSSRLHLEEIS